MCLHSVGGSERFCSDCGRQFEGDPKIRNRTVTWSSNSTTRYRSWENKMSMLKRKSSNIMTKYGKEWWLHSPLYRKLVCQPSDMSPASYYSEVTFGDYKTQTSHISRCEGFRIYLSFVKVFHSVAVELSYEKVKLVSFWNNLLWL